MSPEQAAGEQELDGRTDVYSLGVVLYEALAGELPFSGPTPQAIIARRLTEAPQPLRQTRESVPPWVELAVTRALAKAPADRFRTAAEFAEALKAEAPASRPTPRVTMGPRTVPMAALALVLGLGLLFGWGRTHRPDPAATGGAKRLAVIPFENLGPAADEYFADGVADAVRGKLAALPGLQVIASNSSAQYKHTTKSPRMSGGSWGYSTCSWERFGGTRLEPARAGSR
jgi:serine/threonine-protein kinase